MRRSIYWALAWPFYLALILLFLALIALLGLDLLSFAYHRIGIAPGWLVAILVLTIAGSFVNIPVVRLQNPIEPPIERSISFLGVRYVIPTPSRPSETTIAVNVGGAVIPLLLSVYLAMHDHLEVAALIGVVIAAVIVRLVARPIRGVGIAVPIILPALIAVLLASLLTVHYFAALAYIIGVLGVLVGADLSNLGKSRSLGASVVSIGGAGTFDGIFLTGLLAVLLASI